MEFGARTFLVPDAVASAASPSAPPWCTRRSLGLPRRESEVEEVIQIDLGCHLGSSLGRCHLGCREAGHGERVRRCRCRCRSLLSSVSVGGLQAPCSGSWPPSASSAGMTPYLVTTCVSAPWTVSVLIFFRFLLQPHECLTFIVILFLRTNEQ